MSDAAVSSDRAPSSGVFGLLSDRRLAGRAAEGDRRAFAAIFNRYHQDLYRYCRAILRDSQEAQDALQNTMVKALDSLPGEEREIRLKPWLYRVAHNEAVELLRRRRPAAELDPETADPGPRPEDSAEARGRLTELLADLRELPDRQRGALAMRELSGLSFGQIADVFGTSPATARQTVYEARAALQAMGEGREMDCDVVRRALSDGDGRVLRRREIRAHLRACEGCGDFKAGIAERHRELAAIGPLPAVAAAGMLSSLLGGGGTGGGLAALLGGGAGGAGAAAGLKSTAAVVAVSAAGVGAAAGGGAIHIDPPLSGGGDPGTAARDSAASRGAADTDTSTGGASAAGAGADMTRAASGAGAGTRQRGRSQQTKASRRRSANRTSDRAAHGQSTAAAARARKSRPQGLPPAASRGRQTAASRGGGRPTAKSSPSSSSPPPKPSGPPPAKSKSTPAPPPAVEPGLPKPLAPPGGEKGLP